MKSTKVRPWGAVISMIAAAVFAAPPLVLPADSPVGPKLVFIVVGSVLLATAIVATRAEPGSRGGQPQDAEDDVTP